MQATQIFWGQFACFAESVREILLYHVLNPALNFGAVFFAENLVQLKIKFCIDLSDASV